MVLRREGLEDKRDRTRRTISGSRTVVIEKCGLVQVWRIRWAVQEGVILHYAAACCHGATVTSKTSRLLVRQQSVGLLAVACDSESGTVDAIRVAERPKTRRKSQ